MSGLEGTFESLIIAENEGEGAEGTCRNCALIPSGAVPTIAFRIVNWILLRNPNEILKFVFIQTCPALS